MMSECYVTSHDVQTLCRSVKMMNFIQGRVFIRRFRQLHLIWLVLGAKAPLSILTYESEGVFRCFVCCVFSSRCLMCLWRGKDDHNNGQDLAVDLSQEWPKMTRATGGSLSCLHSLYVTRFRTLPTVLCVASFIFIIKLVFNIVNSANQEICCAIRYFK